MSNVSFSSRGRGRYFQNLGPLLQNPTHKAYAMVIASLFAIAFFSFFAIRPTITTIATLQKKISDKKEINQQLEAKINALIEAQASYQNAQTMVPLFYTLLPIAPEFPALIQLLETTAISKSATISGMSFEPIVLYDKVKAATTSALMENPDHISFTLTFTGDYVQLKTLLEQLTKLERLVTINSIVLNTTEKTSSLTLNISSKTYYFPIIQ